MAAQAQHNVTVHHQRPPPVPNHQQGFTSQQVSAGRTEGHQRCIGISLMAFGAIHIVLGVCYMVYQFARLLVGSAIYAGVWGGLYVVATGCIGIAAGRTQSKALIITLLIMSIISIIVAGILVPALMSSDAVLAAQFLNDSNYFTGYSYGTKYAEASVFLSLMGLLGFGCSLTISILTCVDLCRNSKTTKVAQTQMEMLAPTGKAIPPAVVVPSITSVQNTTVTPTAPALPPMHHFHNLQTQPNGPQVQLQNLQAQPNGPQAIAHAQLNRLQALVNRQRAQLNRPQGQFADQSSTVADIGQQYQEMIANLRTHITEGSGMAPNDMGSNMIGEGTTGVDMGSAFSGFDISNNMGSEIMANVGGLDTMANMGSAVGGLDMASALGGLDTMANMGSAVGGLDRMVNMGSAVGGLDTMVNMGSMFGGF